MNDTRHYSTRAEAVTERIDEIMDTFHWGKVARYLARVNWRWDMDGENRVPDDYEVRQEARRLLRKAAVERVGSATGGFMVRYSEGEYEGKPFFNLDLYFVLEDGADDGVNYDTDQ